MTLIEQSLAQNVLDYALKKGADFAELFVERDDRAQCEILSSKVHQVGGGIDFGIGVRLIYGTKVLYGYTNSRSLDDLCRIVDQLCVNDKKPAVQTLPTQMNQVMGAPSYLMGNPPVQPSLKETINFMMEVDKHTRQIDQRFSQVKIYALKRLQEIEIFNSEGLHVNESRPYFRMVSTAIAAEKGKQSTGSFSPGHFAHWDAWSKLYNPEQIAQEISHQALVTLHAQACPAGQMPVVLGDGFGGVIFHEACGHLLETTSVQKKASVFHDKMGEMIANPVVNAVDDGGVEGAWGSVTYDDEGRRTQRTQLIKDGVLTSFLVDKVGAMKTGYEPTGSGRRQSYRYAPASRMRNTYIDAGKDSFEQMISSIDKGIYCKNLGGGSVNPGTGEFNFAATESYLIIKGKIAEPVKGATLIGKGPEVLKQISMVGPQVKMSAGMCGSVSGAVPVTVGQPPLKIDSILVGGSAV